MSTQACECLREAFIEARARPTRVLVLMGGQDFYSNGLDLNAIEAASSPPDESLRNIAAMDDLCQAILETGDRITVSALQGNAGAGGAFLALTADFVWARHGVILNPHYKNMGNLYGSEYWTYLLPKRVGETRAREIMEHRLPLGTADARELGFVDEVFDAGPAEFPAEVTRRAIALATSKGYADRLARKRECRVADEAQKPLAQYRSTELAHMQRNFFGFDPSYHVARHHFVRKTPHSWTPRHLARHRNPDWRVPDNY
jgi:putative two-component system hydrogenase maturation factor HypX/HoxX